MKEQIEYYQRKLKMSSSLMEIYPSITAKTHENFLLELLKHLYEERCFRTRERNLKQAMFPNIKTLEKYSFEKVNLPEKLNIEELLSLSFLEKQENLVLYGPVGTGKTHLAIGLGLKAINNNYNVLFFTIHDLVNKLMDAKEKGVLSRVMKKIEKADLLILDEWGYLPLHIEGARLIFEVISRCYEKKSLILTTNIEFSKWKGFLFDEKLTAAIIDRVVHHSHMIIFTGSSHRVEQSLMK